MPEASAGMALSPLKGMTMLNFTQDQLAAMLDDANRQTLAGTWLVPLQQAMDESEINTRPRGAAFLAQVIHESDALKVLSENLNYSTAARLCAIWPTRFPSEQAALPYVKQPELLANFVYASRMGNGDVHSGDGWRFRGRGLIQLTGRGNYVRCATALRLDLVGAPDLLQQPPAAARSAAWFWKSSGLNELADPRPNANATEDFARITKIINGGTHGLAERQALWQRCLKILNNS
jgi:putative chitinase